MVDRSAELYHSVVNNDLVGLQRLIREGADVNQFYDDLSHANSKSILHFACGKGMDECVNILLENGAHVNTRDKWRMTPLMYCISMNNLKISKMIIEKDQSSLNKQDMNGVSPLHFAVENLADETTAFLVHAGSNVNIQDFKGFTPLMTIVAQKSVINYISIMKILTEAGEKVNIEGFMESRTALDLAAISKKKDAVELLLQLNGDPNHIDSGGKTPLTNMISYQQARLSCSLVDNIVMEIATLFTLTGADMNINISEHCNPLIMAVKTKSHKLSRLFLEHGADVNITSPIFKVSPLMMAIKQNDIETIRVLLNWNCNLDRKCRLHGSEFELDPFELAVNEELWGIVRLLGMHGCNMSKIDFLREMTEYTLIPDSLKSNVEMLKFMQQLATNPKSLFKSCVLVIFSAIKSNISKEFQKLPIPSTLKTSIIYDFFSHVT